MDGYAKISLLAIKLIDNFIKDHEEDIKKIHKEVLNRAHDKYVANHVGKRYWWLWFGIVSVSKERAEKWSYDHFNGYYSRYDRSVYYLEVDKNCELFLHNVDYLKTCIFNIKDEVHALIKQTEHDVFLSPAEVKRIDNMLFAIKKYKEYVVENIQKDEFPFSL